MRKCLIMFALLVMTLVLAAVTDNKQETTIDDKLALQDNAVEDIAFEQTGSDQKRSTKDQ